MKMKVLVRANILVAVGGALGTVFRHTTLHFGVGMCTSVGHPYGGKVIDFMISPLVTG